MVGALHAATPPPPPHYNSIHCNSSLALWMPLFSSEPKFKPGTRPKFGPKVR